jgi:hypothetical protein
MTTTYQFSKKQGKTQITRSLTWGSTSAPADGTSGPYGTHRLSG